MFGLLAATVAAHAAGDGWLTSYDAAVKQAKQRKLPILADFTGSDWCPPCKQLTKEVFESDVFKKWAKTKVVLLRLDFPRHHPFPAGQKEQNIKLGRTYGIESFPTVLFIHPDGKEINRIVGYPPLGPTNWTRSVDLILQSRAERFAPSKPQGQTKMTDLVAEEGYPAYVTTKTMYAKHDLRGTKMPELKVDKWLKDQAPDTKGKVVIVDMWATWCPPCRALIPELNGYAKQFPDDVVVIGISDEKFEKVSEFASKTEMNYFVGIDEKSQMMNTLGVEGIPHCYVITPDGIVRYQGFPLDEKDPLTADKLKQIIDASKKKASAAASRASGSTGG